MNNLALENAIEAKELSDEVFVKINQILFILEKNMDDESFTKAKYAAGHLLASLYFDFMRPFVYESHPILDPGSN
jgi:hypothetical protein